MSPWERLRRGLAPPSGRHVAPGDGRQAAVLVLLSEAQALHGAVELVYIRRCDHLAHHPGQIAFPGGRLDDEETAEEAALREAAEEVALDRDTAEVLGRLPALFVPPSGFWLQPVVGRWHAPHPLRRAEDEVTEILRVSDTVLTDPANWRVVRAPGRGPGWAWQLHDGHLLWGATAAVTTSLLELLAPGWRGGVEAHDLGPAREVDRLRALEQG